MIKYKCGMTIETLVEDYMKLCKKHGYSNVKSIPPAEYRINVNPHHVIDGKVKMVVTTYTGKTVMIEHIDKFSYAENLQTLKNL